MRLNQKLVSQYSRTVYEYYIQMSEETKYSLSRAQMKTKYISR